MEIDDACDDFVETRRVRDSKGNSLTTFISDYVALDFETTGLDPRYDEIIEIGALRISEGKVIDRYVTLVKPRYQVNSFITELTGITNDMLKDSPKINSALPDLIRFIGDSAVVGHNVNFDVNFLYDACVECLKTPFKNDFVDVMRLSKRLFTDFKNHKLSTLVKNLNIADAVSHRAESDCYAAYQCYEYIKTHASNSGLDESFFKRTKHHLKACELVADASDFDDSHPVYGRTFAFTGALEKMQRKDAMQLVLNLGGSCADNVTKKVNYLVLGNNDYCSSIKDGKSLKQKKAEGYVLEGHDITVISEHVFYDMVES